MLIKEGIRLLGRNHKLGLFIIMASISIPAATHINVVATEFDYSQKSNLGTIRTGSYLSQASMLVYDDILRFQNSTTNPTADISDFNYNEFEGNILWFMDELVGMESDWIKDASNNETTAYGYVQFTEDSVETAVNRYIGHLERFNERSLTRDWVPYSIKLGETLPIPEWLTTLKNSTKTHKEKLDALTYDEMLALAFVHLHRKESKDSNFVLLAKGDIYASKEIYKNNHHTNPDAATLTRLEGFFPWRKQNIYEAALAAVTTKTWMKKSCPGDANQTKTATDVINILSSKLNILSGDNLFWDFQNQTGVTVTGVTAQVHPGYNRPYTDWHPGLTNAPGSATLKAFKRVDASGDIGYYFYRENGDTVWLQNLKNELNSNPTLYNFDELYNTINSWNLSVNTYILDWWIYNETEAIAPGGTLFNFITPPQGFAAPFPISNGFNWYNTAIDPNGICVLGLSTQPSIRGQFSTMFHEAGGHAIHNNLADGWAGGLDTSGNEILLSDSQTRALLTLYQNYKVVEDAKIVAAGGVTTAYHDRVFNNLPMGIIRALGLYTAIPEQGETAGQAIARKQTEEEFLCRVYQIMAINKCITFKDDIWPVMKGISPGIDPNIIDINIATAIDQLMLNEMGLNKRGIV